MMSTALLVAKLRNDGMVELIFKNQQKIYDNQFF